MYSEHCDTRRQLSKVEAFQNSDWRECIRLSLWASARWHAQCEQAGNGLAAGDTGPCLASEGYQGCPERVPMGQRRCRPPGEYTLDPSPAHLSLGPELLLITPP